MSQAILILVIIAAALGLALLWVSRHFHVARDEVAEQIEALLPQTQCAQCGYPGCRPYAEAIARGEVEINRCPPGGAQTIQALAQLLGRDAPPLASDVAESKAPVVAWIDESQCIGCTLCIQACPVDAILGTAKRMHTVIAEECTGCELCLPPCPVDCIELHLAQRPAMPHGLQQQERPPITAGATKNQDSNS